MYWENTVAKILDFVAVWENGKMIIKPKPKRKRRSSNKEKELTEKK